MSSTFIIKKTAQEIPLKFTSENLFTKTTKTTKLQEMFLKEEISLESLNLNEFDNSLFQIDYDTKTRRKLSDLVADIFRFEEDEEVGEGGGIEEAGEIINNNNHNIINNNNNTEFEYIPNLNGAKRLKIDVFNEQINSNDEYPINIDFLDDFEETNSKNY